MKKAAIAAGVVLSVALLIAATPNGSVMSYNGDAAVWAPSSAPTQVTIIPSQVSALSDAGYVYDDLRVPLTSLSKTAGTSPDFVEIMDSTGTGGSGGIFAWAFRATQEDSLVAITQNPHNRAPGTEMEAHLHWTMTSPSVGPTDAGSLAAVWQLECAIAEVGGSFKVATTTGRRGHSGYTATVRLAANKLEVGQNIVVSGVTEAGSCSAGAYNGTYRVASVSGLTITYTTSVSCSESDVDDTGGSLAGYTITRTADGTVAEASQYKHLMTSFGTYRMVNCTTASCVWVCTLSRPTSTGDVQEAIPALELDWHYAVGRLGTTTP